MPQKVPRASQLHRVLKRQACRLETTTKGARQEPQLLSADSHLTQHIWSLGRLPNSAGQMLAHANGGGMRDVKEPAEDGLLPAACMQARGASRLTTTLSSPPYGPMSGCHKPKICRYRCSTRKRERESQVEGWGWMEGKEKQRKGGCCQTPQQTSPY